MNKFQSFIVSRIFQLKCITSFVKEELALDVNIVKIQLFDRIFDFSEFYETFFSIKVHLNTC